MTIRSIVLDSFLPPRGELTVRCSKGTYMRTLCHDVGRALGVGGCMEGLRRTRSGAFTLGAAASLEDLLSRTAPDALLIDTVAALPFPRHEADEAEAHGLLSGRPVPWAGGGGGVPPGTLIAVVRGGGLLAVAEAGAEKEGPVLVPRKVFPPRCGGGGNPSKSLCKSPEKC